MDSIEYKGYVGSVDFSEPDRLFYGKVENVRALVSYEGATIPDLIADFHDAVDAFSKMKGAGIQ